MSCVLVTDSSVYPITTAEAKSHLNIDHSDDDTLIDTYIAAATEYVEDYVNRELAQRTWDYSFDKFPVDEISLPKHPVLSVSSITYTDRTASPITQTVLTSVYDVDLGGSPADIYLKYGQTWPTASYERNSITVRFVTGFAGVGSPVDYRAGIPQAIRAAIKLMVGDLYLNRESNLDMQTYHNETIDRLLDMNRFYQ